MSEVEKISSHSFDIFNSALAINSSELFEVKLLKVVLSFKFLIVIKNVSLIPSPFGDV